MSTTNVNTRKATKPAANIEQANQPSVPKDRVEDLSEEFLASAAKSAEGVLSMATAVVEAKKLSAADFTRFCELIGYDEKSSSIRKLESIGKRHAIFAENIHKLPNTWTTLYLMTKLSDAELKQAFEAGQITRSTTAIKLSEMFPKLASHRRQGSNGPSAAHSEVVPNGTNGDELVIKLPSVPNVHQLAKLREMLKWLQEEEICVHLGQKVSELLSDDHDSAEQELKRAA